MKNAVGLCAILVALAQSTATAQRIQVVDGSEGMIENKFYDGTNRGSAYFVGYYRGGDVKDVVWMEVRYTGQLADKKINVNYRIRSMIKAPIERSADGKTLSAGGLDLDTVGFIEHVDGSGKTNNTCLTGMLLNDERDITGSWLISTNCTLLPPTVFSKLRATLKKPLDTASKEPQTNFSSPIWLFKIQTNYSLSIQP